MGQILKVFTTGLWSLASTLKKWGDTDEVVIMWKYEKKKLGNKSLVVSPMIQKSWGRYCFEGDYIHVGVSCKV